MIGKDSIITKAVIFSVNRHPNVSGGSVFRVDLNGITSLSEVIARIANVLSLKNPEPTEKSLIEQISKLQSYTLVVYFARCHFLTDPGMQT
jgi:hypothetical protein